LVELWFCNLLYRVKMITFEFLIEGVLLCMVGCVGILSNIMAILFFARQQHHIFYRSGFWGVTHGFDNSIFSLMLTLCCYDLVYLMYSLVIFSLPLLCPSLPFHIFFPYSVTYLLTVAHVGMTGAEEYKLINFRKSVFYRNM
jgi:hypothetical protein